MMYLLIRSLLCLKLCNSELVFHGRIVCEQKTTQFDQKYVTLDDLIWNIFGVSLLLCYVNFGANILLIVETSIPWDIMLVSYDNRHEKENLYAHWLK